MSDLNQKIFPCFKTNHLQNTLLVRTYFQGILLLNIGNFTV